MALFWTTLLMTFLHGYSSNAQETTGFYRVQAELLQLQNPLGVRHDGAPCDRLGVCDPVIKVFLDKERPLSAFPGPRYISQYERIFSAVDTNEPMINKQVSVDICNAPFVKANLRAYVKDDDSFLRLTDDHISDFDCYFSPPPAADEASAEWSAGEPCNGHNQPGKVKLFFRYRVFRIPADDCGRQLVGSTVAPTVAPITPVGTHTPVAPVAG